MIKYRSLQKSFLAVILFLAANPVLPSNPYRLTAGARQAGMANTTIAIDGYWASFHNQASLGYMKQMALGINHDSRFGITELSNKTFSLIIPSGHGALGAVYSYYGYSEYKRHTAALSYGMMLGEKISAGIQADFYSTRVAGNYRNTNQITFETGIMYRPVPELTIGMHVFNPLPNSIREAEIPAVLRVGVAYYFVPEFLFAAEYEADSSSGDIIRFAAEYQVLQNIYIRGGVMADPWGFSFGAGYAGKRFEANLGFITHETLGLSPSLSLVILLG